MKVLLINPSLLQATVGHYSKSMEKLRGVYPSLGLLYIASVLEQDGNEVKVLEMDIEDPGSAVIEAALCSFQADVVGIHVMTWTFKIVCEMVASIRKQAPDAVIIAGGANVASFPELSVELAIDPSPVLPPMVHIAFYRVAQEALNNVVKHSDASHVSVSLRASPPVSSLPGEDWQGQVTLCVSDDGRGFDQGQVGPEQLGLSIMRERAAAMGGRLNITSQPDRGTQVWLDWGSRLL